MEGFSKVIESVQLPLDIPIRPYVSDHCFNGQAVLPAVEAMETLAQAIRRFRPATDVNCMKGATFDKFLYLDPGAEHLSAFGEISVLANGDVTAVLTTKTKSKHAVMSRLKTHATLTFPHQEASFPELPLDVASAPEGVCIPVAQDKIYPDLVAFGPFYRNVIALHVTPQGAVAEIRNPVVEDAGAASSNLLGSPFALDAAFHVACVWGQRFTGIVAFPVGVNRRRIYAPTLPAETYFVHVMPTQVDPALLMFDLRIYDREGFLHEVCSGVRMRDVSAGRMRPRNGYAPAPGPRRRIGLPAHAGPRPSSSWTRFCLLPKRHCRSLNAIGMPACAAGGARATWRPVWRASGFHGCYQAMTPEPRPRTSQPFAAGGRSIPAVLRPTAVPLARVRSRMTIDSPWP